MYHQVIILVKEILERIELVGGGQKRLMTMTCASLTSMVIASGTMVIDAMVGLAQLYLTLQSNGSPRTE